MTNLNFNPIQAAEDNNLSAPLGVYKAAITAKDFTFKTPKGKSGILITFEIAEGDNKGKKVDRFFDVFAENATRQNIERAELGKLAQALGLDKAESQIADNYAGYLTIEAVKTLGKDNIERVNLKFHPADAQVSATSTSASF